MFYGWKIVGVAFVTHLVSVGFIIYSYGVFLKALAEEFGKTVAESKDYPAFIANRILIPFINEAVYALFEGVGSAESIDTVAKLSFNHPMGPLELADFSGLDTALRTAKALEGVYGARYRPTHTMRNLVCAGHLGRKTGRGWHPYE